MTKLILYGRQPLNSGGMMELYSSFGSVLRYLRSLIGSGAKSQPNGPAVFPPCETWSRAWGTEQLLDYCEHYTLKKINMEPNESGGLQYHHKKTESGWVLYGEATVEYDPGDGVLTMRNITHGDVVRFPQGAVHRMTAGPSGCTYIEVSTPYFHDRCHVEKEYGLKEETGGLPSTRPEDVVRVPRHKPWLLITDPQDKDFGC